MASFFIRRWFLLCVFICFAKKGPQGKTLRDLRQFHVTSIAGLFSVPRSSLEIEVSNIKMQDTLCGNDINMTLAESTDLPNSAEIFIVLFTVEDHTLKEDLTCDMKKEVDVNFRHLSVALPFVSGERRRLIFLAHFTDSTKRTFLPYGTNYERVNKIDNIEESENGTVILSKGDDIMIMNIQHNVTCQRDQSKKMRDDFDEATGEMFTASDYPFTFDWGCDILGDDVSFCNDLKENECGLSRAGSDVCTEMTTSYSKRCPANIQISSMTGVFQDAVPYFSAPVSNIEGTWVDREHGTNIIFPCFTPDI